MQFANLQTTSPAETLSTFNTAFSDYLVPLRLSPEQMEQKLQVEGYAPELSAGAFTNGKLVGLILHAKGFWKAVPTAYNSGTGVTPNYRGQQLTQRMYAHILPRLAALGIRKSLLEVIEGNHRALHTYQNVGFQVARELDSYRGELSTTAPDPEIQELAAPDWQELQHFWSWQPSWQHSAACLQRAEGSYKTYAYAVKGKPVAYATINPLTNRIPSFAVLPAYRSQGMATRLFRHLQHLYPHKPLTVINVATTAPETKDFLNKLGLERYLRQYEMELAL